MSLLLLANITLTFSLNNVVLLTGFLSIIVIFCYLLLLFNYVFITLFLLIAYTSIILILFLMNGLLTMHSVSLKYISASNNFRLLINYSLPMSSFACSYNRSSFTYFFSSLSFMLRYAMLCYSLCYSFIYVSFIYVSFIYFYCLFYVSYLYLSDWLIDWYWICLLIPYQVLQVLLYIVTRHCEQRIIRHSVVSASISSLDFYVFYLFSSVLFYLVWSKYNPLFIYVYFLNLITYFDSLMIYVSNFNLFTTKMNALGTSIYSSSLFIILFLWFIIILTSINVLFYI